MLRKFISVVGRSGGVRDIFRLSLGTLIGRVITLAALPVVTRLYSPEEYSMLAIYLAVLAIVSVAACLRFDVAIPLARDDDDALHLLVMGLACSFFLTLVMSVLVFSASEEVALALGQPEMAGFLWLVPVGVLMVSSYSVFQNWATRARNFSAIAKTRAVQSLVGVLVVLGLGFLGVKPLGLLLGNLLAVGAGFFSLALLAFSSLFMRLRGLSFAGFRSTLTRYKDYPQYSVLDSLANVIGLQLSVILIGKLLGAEAGFFMLAMQLMSAPVALLGGSVAQVYISRAPERQGYGELAVFTLGVLRRLVRVGVAPLVILGVLAPVIIPLIFGAQWERTGEIISWMIPWILFQFVASPVSMVMAVVGRQNIMLALTSLGMLLRLGGGVLVWFAFKDFYIEAFAVSSAIFYGFCLCVFSRSAGIGWRSFIYLFGEVFVIAAIAFACGVGVMLFLERLI